MPTLQDVIGQELTWEQPALFKRIYELRMSETVFATLTWQRGWRSVADLKTPYQQWTIQRQGFWRPRIIVSDNAGTVIARLTHRWSSGTLTFANGAAYTIKRQGFWNGEWFWLTPQETPALRIKPRWGGSRRARVVVEPTGAALPELPILAGVGWYLLIQMADEAVAASAATTAATV